MKHPTNPEAELQKAICEKRAVVVAGTGVSIAASRNPATGKSHPEASWSGLLENGLAWLKEHDLIAADEAAAHLTLLRKRADTHHFISAAQDITRLMGGVDSQHFKNWLKRTVGSLKAHDRKVLDGLEAIRTQGNLLATTNYDGLLLTVTPNLKPVTWKDTDAFVRAARKAETDKIIFLHGYWQQSQSVILDWSSYDRIARDERYRQDLAAIWHLKTWVYVGCGVNGLSDPDFGLLLERYGRRAREAELWDFCLVRSSQREEFQNYFDENEINICAVSFGDAHDNLPAYLHSLLPTPICTITPKVIDTQPSVKNNPIPKPPAFYAEPDYIGSHKFIGRTAELQVLSDWAKPADPTNLLLFEAIGGNGKSMLTWEWTTNPKHALVARPAGSPWAGCFWYSFYERGALMSDFCQHALAYMTGRTLEDFAKKKTAELKDELLAQLHAQPWLLILDGLERVLVAYHRIDAAEVPDEEANAPTDKIVNRNPCAAIRDEDNDLLRTLAAAAPSKILVSSRLTPHVLVNSSGQPISGAKRITLSGLRPPDAEALLRSCSIRGNSTAIQSYLTANCDNHPLVIGILGGLIANYLPARGNFDTWSAAADGGAALDLSKLDMIQRRNHILSTALDALPPEGKQLLSTLALLTESVDYETLKAFNPHLPPEPEEVKKPKSLEKRQHWVDNKSMSWEQMSSEQKVEPQKQYESGLTRWQNYEKAVQTRLASADFRAAPKKLEATVKDLEQRGLLQWDGRDQKYDLHPVVRGVASGTIAAADKERHGQRLVDYFTAQYHRPYEEAETMQDVRNGMHIVRTLLKLCHFQQAADTYRRGLSNAMFFNLNAYAEVLSLLKPFFPMGWSELPNDVKVGDGSFLANSVAIALDECGEPAAALVSYGVAFRSIWEAKNWQHSSVVLYNISHNLAEQNQLAHAFRINNFALDFATLIEDQERIFGGQLFLFSEQTKMGQWVQADTTWQLLNPMGRNWHRRSYRPGDAEERFANFHFCHGTLQEEHLAEAMYLAVKGKNRSGICNLYRLRGNWRLEQGNWGLAAASYQEAVRLARERGLTDAVSETGLALAKHHLGQLSTPRDEAERLLQLRNPAHRYLALIWQGIGDPGKAKHHALAAYKWAWADGEPYVYRYELTKTTEVLQQLNVPIPTLPPYDPAKEKPFPWEADVRAVIEKLRAEKETEKAAKKTNQFKPSE